MNCFSNLYQQKNEHVLNWKWVPNECQLAEPTAAEIAFLWEKIASDQQIIALINVVTRRFTDFKRDRTNTADAKERGDTAKHQKVHKMIKVKL